MWSGSTDTSAKKLNIPVSENSWKPEPKAIIENSVNIENKALRPGIVFGYKKEKNGVAN